MATRQELDEQKALQDQQLALRDKQLRDSYNLSQAQLAEQQKEKELSSAKLAQQAYLTKEQTNRLMPNVLSAQGLAKTGYVNTKNLQISEGYKKNYNAIQDDLASAKAEFARRDASEDLAYQQAKDALELDRQAYALDYRQALSKLSSQSSGGGISNNNFNLIYQGGAKNIEGNMSPNDISAFTQGFMDQGYITDSQRQKLNKNLTDYAYTYNTGIAPVNIPTVKPKVTTPAKTTTNNKSTNKKVQKALVVGQW